MIKRKTKNTHFIKVLAIISMLGIGALILTSACLITSVTAERLNHRVTAINLAREKVEKIRAMPGDKVLSQVGSENVIIDTGSAVKGTEIIGQRATAVSDLSGNSKQYRVTVCVSWVERRHGKLLEERIVTLISNKAGRNG